MKKIFLVALFTAICFYNVVTQAVTHSTQADFNAAWQASITAISETADYVNLINNVDYDVAIVRLQDCNRHQKILEFSWQEAYKGKEAVEVALLATIIMQERGATLDYFISAVKAFRANKISLFEEYMKKMSAYNKRAEKSRQEFRVKYGY